MFKLVMIASINRTHYFLSTQVRFGEEMTTKMMSKIEMGMESTMTDGLQENIQYFQLPLLPSSLDPLGHGIQRIS